MKPRQTKRYDEFINGYNLIKGFVEIFIRDEYVPRIQ